MAKKPRGFSLIELLLVVGLLALVLGLAAPLLINHLKHLSLNQSARSVVHWMRYAQYRAIADGESRTLWFDLDENTFQIVRPSEEEDEYIEMEGALEKPIELESSVQIDPASEMITYYPDGSSSGGTLILRSASAVAEIHVKPGLGRLEIAFADQKV